MNDLVISVLDRYCVRNTTNNDILFEGTYRACVAFRDSLNMGHTPIEARRVGNLINQETKEINTK